MEVYFQLEVQGLKGLIGIERDKVSFSKARFNCIQSHSLLMSYKEGQKELLLSNMVDAKLQLCSQSESYMPSLEI